MASNVAGSSGPVAYIADILGASEPALRLFYTILLGYPLAYFHRTYLFGKSPCLQHLFFIGCGLTLGYYNYGNDMIHSIISVLFTYLLLFTMGGTFNSVIISFVFNMSYLMFGYYVTGTDDYDIKWSMPHCVLTLRLIGLAFDVYDGQKKESELSNDQKKTALRNCPSLIEVAGHTYFFGGFMVGPQFPMKRYIDFINGSFPAKTIAGKPSCIGAGLKRLGVGILILSIYQVGNTYIPEKVFLSDAYVMEYPLWKKLIIMGLWGKIVLYKYIACWLVSEGSCIMAGLTYNGKDSEGNDLWDGCANAKMRQYTTSSTFAGLIQSFNINTNLWVAQYVFKRLKFLGNRYISQAAALLFLAVWHGLHSGYYVCFMNEFIVMYFEKDFESFLDSRFPKVKAFFMGGALRPVSLVLMRVFVDIMMGYSLVGFVLLSFGKYMKAYSTVYFCGHILYFGWPLLAIALRKLIPRSKSKADKDKAQ
ncbi:hypothetical protein JTE90_013498 [Oedothorax gibbosus]|uniref:Lysophospholipid acyltransferase 5 n=1 Tax=Oedothorax gibbosus TaxID=931172 RepID=A0AAV6VNT0_9ARAC|nr:hypothetical protein JTE90_013498 [Oedothorax gibbosus]